MIGPSQKLFWINSKIHRFDGLIGSPLITSLFCFSWVQQMRSTPFPLRKYVDGTTSFRTIDPKVVERQSHAHPHTFIQMLKVLKSVIKEWKRTPFECLTH